MLIIQFLTDNYNIIAYKIPFLLIFLNIVLSFLVKISNNSTVRRSGLNLIFVLVTIPGFLYMAVGMYIDINMLAIGHNIDEIFIVGLVLVIGSTLLYDKKQ